MWLPLRNSCGVANPSERRPSVFRRPCIAARIPASSSIMKTVGAAGAFTLVPERGQDALNARPTTVVCFISRRHFRGNYNKERRSTQRNRTLPSPTSLCQKTDTKNNLGCYPRKLHL